VEAARQLPVVEVPVETPLEPTTGSRLPREIAIVPVLRAGLGMVDPFLRLLPDARVGHVGVCTRFLGAGGSATLLRELGAFGVAGRAVYDALVGACAREHALPLATRDRRALETYRLLDLDIELVD
jgi:uracil phosphoribosyltransferase-like protein